MEILFSYILPFLVLLTILVFVHELGHYWVARRNGVRVETFSIGFGPEIFGWTDRRKTRWKFSAIPLGGYVKMFGEADVTGADGVARQMSPEERAVSFSHKTLGQRTAIVFAGPAANFIFAIIALAVLFMTAGQPYTPPTVGNVVEGSAAEEAGILPGDRFVRVGNESITRFEEVQRLIRSRPGEPVMIVLLRGEEEVAVTATPQVSEIEDISGNLHRVGMLGVTREGVEYRHYGPFGALWAATRESATMCVETLRAVGQIIAGTRGTEELGGPIRIGQMSGDIAQSGIAPFIWFMALISINLGLINLFPIPMLDGGHLLFYAIEAVRGKPMGPRAQEMGFRIGLVFVLGLMLFVTINDLVTLNVF